jgi:hypothetical protein
MATPRSTELADREPMQPIFPLGGTLAIRFTTHHVIIEDQYDLHCYIDLNFMRFNVLRSEMKFIDELIVDGIDYDFKGFRDYEIHLGGPWYVELFTKKKVIDIRRWQYRHRGWEPSKRGITLTHGQWERLKEVMAVIPTVRPDILAVIPCKDQDSHYDNQEGMYNEMLYDLVCS